MPVTITTDGHRVRQILVNLLTNAVKFTETGEVSLGVSTGPLEGGDPAVVFEVKDTGIGIPEKALATLFDSFQQVDPSTSRRYGGTGLGLAISRNLAELLGGDIAVASTLGEGSCFTVRVPARDAVLPGPEDLGAGSLLHDRVMMVVLDNPTDQRLLEGFGRGWGMEVVTVESMREALEAAEKRRRIDIVLIDHQNALAQKIMRIVKVAFYVSNQPHLLLTGFQFHGNHRIKQTGKLMCLMINRFQRRAANNQSTHGSKCAHPGWPWPHTQKFIVHTGPGNL